jgi:hypothetical protein
MLAVWSVLSVECGNDKKKQFVLNSCSVLMAVWCAHKRASEIGGNVKSKSLRLYFSPTPAEAPLPPYLLVLVAGLLGLLKERDQARHLGLLVARSAAAQAECVKANFETRRSLYRFKVRFEMYVLTCLTCQACI